MQLSKEMPELLNSELIPNLNLTQAITLMSAPDELKAEIVERGFFMLEMLSLVAVFCCVLFSTATFLRHFLNRHKKRLRFYS